MSKFRVVVLRKNARNDSRAITMQIKGIAESGLDQKQILFKIYKLWWQFNGRIIRPQYAPNIELTTFQFLRTEIFLVSFGIIMMTENFSEYIKPVRNNSAESSVTCESISCL